MMPNFYPRSPCGERLALVAIIAAKGDISIHALLAESDYNAPERDTEDIISIHALLAESDTAGTAAQALDRLFLSTLSLRRATPQPGLHRAAYRYFYPRSPCGERPGA